MKVSAALAFTVSVFLGISTAQAQQRQLFVYSGTSHVEVPAATLRSPAAPAVEAPVARKVRVVLQSPYGS